MEYLLIVEKRTHSLKRRSNICRIRKVIQGIKKQIADNVCVQIDNL